MRKIHINKTLKITALVVLLIGFGIISFQLYNHLNHPEVEEKKVPLYSYRQDALANYDVALKPNSLYEKSILGENETYIANYVDSVKASFRYNFSGERETDIKGSYEIAAVVEGNTMEKEKVLVLWKKQFILVPKTNFEAKDRALEIKKDIIFSPNEYREFADKIMEESEVNLQVKLSTMMNINLKAQTDKGLIEESVATGLSFPLSTNYYTITKQQIDNKPGVIEETVEIQLPFNKPWVIIYSVSLGILFIALMILLFFTDSTGKKDPYVKLVNKIFKKHGNRLVALNEEVTATREVYHKVKSIDDLVRVSDEIGKPILYRYSAVPTRVKEFYVFDDSCTYILDLTDTVKLMENYNEHYESIESKKEVDSEKPEIDYVSKTNEVKTSSWERILSPSKSNSSSKNLDV